MTDACITIENQGMISHGNIDTRLNFNGGITVKYVSNAIMTKVEHQEARERNKQNHEERTTARERLRAITNRLTAGKLTSEGSIYYLAYKWVFK